MLSLKQHGSRTQKLRKFNGTHTYQCTLKKLVSCNVRYVENECMLSNENHALKELATDCHQVFQSINRIVTIWTLGNTTNSSQESDL